MLSFGEVETRSLNGTDMDMWVLFNGTICVGLKNTDLSTEANKERCRLDIERVVLDIADYDIGFDHRLLPHLMTYLVLPSPNYLQVYRTNIQQLIHHSSWPQILADRMVYAAQGMVGYFTGHPTETAQMKTLQEGLWGPFDPSVKVNTAVQWQAPYELTDDCVFCQRMTDESVQDRVAGFQWAIDKEVARMFGAGMAQTEDEKPPIHDDYSDSYEDRRRYHNELRVWLKGHPKILKPVMLIDLPRNLQRVLCVQWNHLILDFFTNDPRYSYRESDNTYWKMDVSIEGISGIVPQYMNRNGQAVGGTFGVEDEDPMYPEEGGSDVRQPE